MPTADLVTTCQAWIVFGQISRVTATSAKARTSSRRRPVWITPGSPLMNSLGNLSFAANHRAVSSTILVENEALSVRRAKRTELSIAAAREIVPSARVSDGFIIGNRLYLLGMAPGAIEPDGRSPVVRDQRDRTPRRSQSMLRHSRCSSAASKLCSVLGLSCFVRTRSACAPQPMPVESVRY